LVAQLATAAGGRAPLAHVAGQVFFELVRELKTQGLGNKVIADMFGLTLRTYHDRVRRTSESATDRGTSLWEAVLRTVRERQLVTKAELLRRFRADDEATVRGVLSDLVDSGLLFKSGRAESTAYRAASAAETEAMLNETPEARIPGLLWVWLHQHGPSTAVELARELSLPADAVALALSQLETEGRLRQSAPQVYQADECIIPYGDELGWEAAVFDHFQTVATSIGSKVTMGKKRSALNDAVGGSTYHLDLFRGHPQEAEVLSLLQSVRERVSTLRNEVDQTVAPASAETYRVVFYAGQNVVGLAELNRAEIEGDLE
jgi:hypothetical protein